MNVKISVIVPVYRVESFIGRCARSLFMQTLSEGIEFIFIDDATPDCSIDIVKEVLEDFPTRKEQVRIIRHDKNRGLPDARNTGLAASRGEFIYHCDSDDFIEPDMIASMLQAAENKNADFVWCDWFLTLTDSERIMHEPDIYTVDETLRTMLSGGMKFNVWNKLVRSSLYRESGIVFPSGNGMGEDLTMIMLCANARNVAHVAKPYYHYVKTNGGAFSNTYSAEHLLQLRNNVDRISEYFRIKFGSKYEENLSFLKLDVKFPFLLMGSKKFRQLWKEWYPDANYFILRNKYVSARTRCIQWCAYKELWIIVKIYSYLLNKIVYGKHK